MAQTINYDNVRRNLTLSYTQLVELIEASRLIPGITGDTVRINAFDLREKLQSLQEDIVLISSYPTVLGHSLLTEPGIRIPIWTYKEEGEL